MESTNHSSNMRTSVRVRMENGMYTPPSAPYGYRLVNKRLEIVPEEAEVVTRIYAEYLSGQGYDSIASGLNQSKTTAGRGVWRSSAIHYILTNITYTGDMIWQKTFAGNTIPFKTIRNKGQKPRYFVEDCHEPIISKADFQKVQELIAARQKQFSCMQIVTDSVYQGHIFCGFCGAKCRRKPDREHVYWVSTGMT